MFSCEYCEISKSSYFQEHLHTAASEVNLGSDCLGLSFSTVTFRILSYSPGPNKIPPPPRLLIFGFFVGTPSTPRPSHLSYLEPLTYLPVINFPDFVLQIFQRLVEPIVLFAKM